MKKKSDAIKEFMIFPIGIIKTVKKHKYVYLYDEYKAGLKDLGKFSHVLLFASKFEEEGADEISKVQTTPIIAKILDIDEKKGVFEIDQLSIKDSMILYDIKPYFPCEERVREFSLGDYVEDKSLWRREIENQKSNLIDNVSIERIINKNDYLYKIGEVKKIEGEFFLELDNIKDIMHKIKGFSHIRIIWWFDKFDKSKYRKSTECNTPYEGKRRMGVFATRSPVRPNPLASTVAKVFEVDKENRRIKISQIDSFDKTPIIDIIPYIPANNRVKDCKVPQWLEHWPKWIDDRGFINSEDIQIEESDIKKLSKYLSIQNTLTNDETLNVVNENEYNNTNEIIVRGVKQNNLKNISCNIPKNKMTVVTGVSGSGKSSLVFDTIYAESQRRFMDSMRNSQKNLFNQMEKPDYDQIEGLTPSIAIKQKTITINPRSTVGTLTDIYDYLKLLYANIGTRHCPECGRAITPLKAEEIVDILFGLREGIAYSIYPFNDDNKIASFIACDDEDYKGNIRKVVKKALEIGKGALVVKINDKEKYMLQTREICYHCEKIFFKLTTSSFSFNNPESMCPVCKGLGVKLEVDEGLIVSKPESSILDGASTWWGNLRKYRQKPNANWMKGEVLALAKDMDIDLELPWNKLPNDFKKQALYGSNNRKVSLKYENSNGRKGEISRPVEGAYNAIKRLFIDNNTDTGFMKESICDECLGERLSKEGRLVTIGEHRFPKVVAMTITQLKNWTENLPSKLTAKDKKVATPILRELKNRLDNLIEVGVSYLTLDRSASTLSGGEAQRIRLATQLASGITNILYVLDEPSIGLHPRDHEKLVNIMHKIRDRGNTLLVVEHDAYTMLSADKIIEIGPGAGIHGGKLIAEGSVSEIVSNEKSSTGRYLRILENKNDTIKVPISNNYNMIKIKKAHHNNLKNIDVSIPIGALTCVTGVSGSGKSSLVSKTLYPAIQKHLSESTIYEYDGLKGIEGIEDIDKIISITQYPIGRTPRSNPATYTGVFDEIRRVFVSLEESKKQGYKQSKFSFNSKAGQCQACKGKGGEYVQMHFMPDIWVKCSVCKGKRFNEEVLKVKYKGNSIADVLDLSIEQSYEIFKDDIKISKILGTLCDVGLGYIKLGQSALTLSGGEAQRVKLAKELSKSDTGKTIYLLDEPTTGLHYFDVQNLIKILKNIVKAGNTVIVIEHNIDMIINSDWIVDLGPEGGDSGGYVIAQGTPQEIKKVKKSYTGQFI
ncbi:excinuclease ABC subunit UvrA [Clostridiaceae bacterium M8S5]|nr:excinuclease ABC subunit UvrA [Clostridiaceae bacterium M8S5]